MSTSVIEQRRRALLRHAAGQLIAAVFCAVFGMIYEHFSFGVYSNFMLYAFMFPLISGLILVLMALGKRPPGRAFLNLLAAASATFALGSLAAGVVKIYGTDNILLKVYPVAGSLMLLLAVYAYFYDRKGYELGEVE